jgi:hypothetical protein
MISKLLLNSSPTQEADQKWREVDSRSSAMWFGAETARVEEWRSSRLSSPRRQPTGRHTAQPAYATCLPSSSRRWSRSSSQARRQAAAIDWKTRARVLSGRREGRGSRAPFVDQ